MAARRHGARLPDISAAGNDNSGAPADQQGHYLSLPSSPTSFRRPPASMSRRPSNAEAPDERSPLLGAPRTTSRIRIHSAHGSPRVPMLSRNQSYAGTRPESQTLFRSVN
jgi:chloride channel 3/4/5